MQIDFNNVRREALASYSGLVEHLRKKFSRDSEITLREYEIETWLDDLRDALIAIAAAYDPDDPNVKNVLGDQVLPYLRDEEKEK